MSLNGDNDEGRTYTVFSLSKLASIALTAEQKHELRTKFNDRVKVEVQHCCTLLADIIGLDSVDGLIDPLGERRHIFGCLTLGGLMYYSVTHAAVKFGHVDCLKMAHEFGFPLHWIDSNVNLLGIRSIEMIPSWVPWTKGIASKAAYYGRLECLEYAHQQGVPWDASTCTAAVINENFDCLKYAVENGCPLDTTKPADAAAYNCNLTFLKYLHEHGCPWSADTCVMAASEGGLECLEYLQANGCPWDIRTCIEAIRFDRYDCLIFAVKKGCPIDGANLADFAALKGSLVVLKCLHEHGCSWSIETCAYAARGGHLDCLVYMHANGCPWDDTTCIEAIMNRHFDCLKFALENSCPLTSPKPAIEAARMGDLSTVKYLHEYGCPWTVVTCSLAASAGDLKYLKHARAYGCPWDSFTCIDALAIMKMVCTNFKDQCNRSWDVGMCIETMYDYKQPNCINYAWKNGCPWREGTCFAGSGDGRMDCLLSEPDHICKWDSEKFRGYAAILRRTSVITSAQITFLLINCDLEPSDDNSFHTVF